MADLTRSQLVEAITIPTEGSGRQDCMIVGKYMSEAPANDPNYRIGMKGRKYITVPLTPLVNTPAQDVYFLVLDPGSELDMTLLDSGLDIFAALYGVPYRYENKVATIQASSFQEVFAYTSGAPVQLCATEWK